MSKIVEMNKGNKEMYNLVMEGVRNVGEKRYVVIPVKLLSADPMYQRIETRNKDKIAKLAREWNPDQMDALKVVAHPESFTYSIVDGYGRWMAATMRGEEYIVCELLVGPTNIEERQKFEANIFLKQTEAVETLKPAQMHNARLLVGDNVAKDLDDLMTEYGVRYTNTKGMREEHYLGSYTRAYQIVKQYTKSRLKYIFEVIQKAGFDLEPNGYSSYVLDSLKKIYTAYPTINPEFVAKLIRPMTPLTLKAKALGKYPEKNTSIAVTLYLQDKITEAYGVQKKFTSYGKAM